ncbi:endolytic transglycosylase MltG [Novosphingobium sp.]|uniref:endolytic transglycosylase MltG n=1 Tax=Novosphingobium sp. TaxID=1874826 RepID=UPI00286D9FFF|nr:endolytic transglycosylase MltG [Novosphingobium sp.]
MMRRGCLLGIIAAIVLALGSLTWLLGGWYMGGPLQKDAAFIVPDGASLSSVAGKLEREGVISSASGFRLRARIFGAGGSIKAGEFSLPAGASPSKVLGILQGGEAVRRFVTVPEGMPSILVYERLNGQTLLEGAISPPPEGSVLPDTYDFERGESRQALVLRMQTAMQRTLAELWEKRSPNTVVKTPQEAVILASIVEKETGKPSERKLVAGLYSNRVRQGIMLQADPTIIYPITKGKPLGRRIKQSEIQAINEYNTYSMVGLPKGPITNPGRASIEAVLNPAKTEALYMVADGTGGHAFASTLAEHNANVEKWYTLRKARGDF